jgi:hypothetical protein
VDIQLCEAANCHHSETEKKCEIRTVNRYKNEFRVEEFHAGM